jgi:hypothetical protein
MVSGFLPSHVIHCDAIAIMLPSNMRHTPEWRRNQYYVLYLKTKIPEAFYYNNGNELMHAVLKKY